MGQQLRPLADFTEEFGLVPRTHMAADYNSSHRVHGTLMWILGAPDTSMVHI